MSACSNCSCPQSDHPGDGFCVGAGCRCDGFDGGAEDVTHATVAPTAVVAPESAPVLPRVIGISTPPTDRTPTLHELFAKDFGTPHEITASVDRKFANSIASQPETDQPVRWTIRPAKPDESEINFIVQTWLRTHKKHSHFFKDVPDSRFFLHRDLVVKALLVRAQVRVAALPDSDVTILGWICWETLSDETLLHYIYVKDAFRNSGVGRSLLATVPPGKVVVTHRTNDANVYLERHKWMFATPNHSPTRIVYDPDMVVQWSHPNA